MSKMPVDDRRQNRYPSEALKMLKSTYNNNPYPSVECKRVLALKAGFTRKQVATWFVNRRRYYRDRERVPQPPYDVQSPADPWNTWDQVDTPGSQLTSDVATADDNSLTCSLIDDLIDDNSLTPGTVARLTDKNIQKHLKV